MNRIHGHEVMQMMLASGQTYTTDLLVQDIVNRFGPAARFYTCSAENMTAAELVGFLAAKGKFVERPNGFQTAPDKLCQH